MAHRRKPASFIRHGSFPRAFLSILPVLVVNLLAVVALWKELKITSFDSALAAITVGSFETAGSILVIAMLIVPAAAAHLLAMLSSPQHGMVVATDLEQTTIDSHGKEIPRSDSTWS